MVGRQSSVGDWRPLCWDRRFLAWQEHKGSQLNRMWRQGRLLEAMMPEWPFEVLLADSFVRADVVWKRAQLCEGGRV